ncbi:hypothetical protein PCL_07117 [Purpureocillium lilacinum]|uniref:NTF2-like protein n=1 Tax=Purpureocillium lilacinum TaxID=33203 RepID=A0A2U3DSX3_PURLI|nr:hypothetical protein PCL_07117 [Purpureocillium lilacinum]
MAAAATYKQFLASPSSSLLADKATLHYIPTTTTFSGATEIIKHLNSLQKQVKKKKEEILNVVDGGSLIAVETDTGLEFQTSGGAYLPGLDDNFVTDRVAYLPIIHIVTFGDDGKITQIRQQWDQGALLKQIEIIGKMGRNWPIKDSREQIAMIQSCLKASGKVSASAPQSHNDVVVRTRGNSNNALRDPHASLQLFGNREELEAVEAASVVSPYAGNRPRQRGFTEILGDEPHDDEDEHRQRSMSPTKVGGGKNFQPMRIFDGQEHREEEEEEESPKRGSTYIRPNPRKYEHFDFADGSDPQDHPERGVSQEERPRSKHDSQWSFNDFVTPHKPKPTKTYRHQDERHWDTEAKNDDEAGKPAGKGRRDAETHFELQDDGERLPHQDRPGTRPRGAMHNEGLGLYKNKLFDQEAATPGPKRALGNITNLKDRTKDFDAHFAMTDDSPAPAPHQSQNVPEARMKAVKMMDANWAAYDKSPTSQKENQPQAKTQEDTKIHIAGDGMGGKKGTDRDWLYGGAAEEKERIHIAGDGMGGKKGTDRNWLYGGNAEEELPKPAPSRKGNAAASQKSFWDF